MRMPFSLSAGPFDARFVIDPQSGREAKIDLRHGADILLHVNYRPAERALVVNSFVDGQWGAETRFERDAATGADELTLTLEIGAEEVVLAFDDRREVHTPPEGVRLSAADTVELTNAIETSGRLYSPRLLRAWRFADATSGHPAPVPSELPDDALRDGLAAIIRAKNEAANVEACLRGICPLVDEVIFVDNASTDGTFTIAKKLQREFFNLKVYSYPFDVPRAGAEHAAEVAAGGTNTLGHFYNWCLSKCTCRNFMKWDADYLVIPENFREMLVRWDLRTRGDNVCVWFSGLEVFFDDHGNHWVDTESKHSEFRLFSKRHGASWVDLLPWEEVDQSYLYRGNKLFFDKPVYLELFRLDRSEFRDRGVFVGDRRDRERLDYIDAYHQRQALPESFVPVSGPADPALAGMALSRHELALAEGFRARYGALPRIRARYSDTEVLSFDAAPCPSVFVMILNCARHDQRRAATRMTWARDLAAAGIPHAFLIGRPGQPAQLVGDCLYVDTQDTYEALSQKVLAGLEHIDRICDVDYVWKIDDDVMLDAAALVCAPVEEFDYIGGHIASWEKTRVDWHFGKCTNPQLNEMPVHATPGLRWFGGQFAYALSRRSREILAAAQGVPHLYEDVAVARTLAAAGVAATDAPPDFQADDFRRWQRNNHPCLALISDIPDTEMVLSTREILSRHPLWGAARQVFAENYRVDADWFDEAAFHRTLREMEQGKVAAQ